MRSHDGWQRCPRLLQRLNSPAPRGFSCHHHRYRDSDRQALNPAWHVVAATVRTIGSVAAIALIKLVQTLVVQII